MKKDKTCKECAFYEMQIKIITGRSYSFSEGMRCNRCSWLSSLKDNFVLAKIPALQPHYQVEQKVIEGITTQTITTVDAYAHQYHLDEQVKRDSHSLTKEEVVEIIKNNIKFSPYGTTNYRMIDSFEKIAEIIISKRKESANG